MTPFVFADSAGAAWEVIDFVTVNGRKKRVPTGDHNADGRAFVPQGREAPVMVYRFGHVAYRTTEPKILEGQLRYAKPSTATPGQRMGG